MRVIAVIGAIVSLPLMGSGSPALSGSPLPTAFTYQGELAQNGAPLNGTADLRFVLYNAATLGMTVGNVVNAPNVSVVNGLFSASVDFGVDAFNGEARWIELSVRSPHDPSDTAPFTTLSPRIAVTATPYTLQTRGIFVDTDENVRIGSPPSAPLLNASPTGKLKIWAHDPGDIGLDAEVDATTGHSDGVHGKSASSQGRGVVGEVTATSGDTKGVHGINASSEGAGIMGEATATGGAATATGVHGKSAASNGAGIMGEATSTTGSAAGVHGSSAAADGKGLLGEATGSANSRGVEGKSTNGEGVHGEGATGMRGLSATAGGKGIVGEATGGGNARGVEGTSPGGEGVHGEGAMGMHGKSASSTGTGMFGEANASTGDAKGMHGKSDSDQGTGVMGEASAASGATMGVHGKSASINGTGIFGEATATTGTASGMHGKTAASDGDGVLGEATATGGTGSGVHGKTASGSGDGILGEATATSGTARGMHGKTSAASGEGVFGEATDGSGSNIGIHGKTNSPSGFAGYFEGRAYVSDRIGVGTDTPTAKLHIAGVSGTDGIRFPDGTLQTSAAAGAASSWQANGSDIYYNNGNVGVGTSTPTAKIFAVQGTGTTGMHGLSTTMNGKGIVGEATGSGDPRGVEGRSMGGEGVHGEGLTGVHGKTSAVAGDGVFGEVTATNSSGSGVHGTTNGPKAGVFGEGLGATGFGVIGQGPVGVYGYTSTGSGVVGVVTSPDPSGAGVRAMGGGVLGTGPAAAALEISDGAIRVSGSARPIGTALLGTISSLPWSHLIKSCEGGFTTDEVGYFADVTISSSLLVPESILLITVSCAQTFRLFVAQVMKVDSGSATIRIATFNGNTPCTVPAGNQTVSLNYLIVNPKP